MFFSDHAVLQRDQPIRVWGWAAPGEKVTVHFHDQTREYVADSIGAWQISLLPEKAGGPYVLIVSGSETEKPAERSDILVGDVWVASGQSNMQFPLKGFPPEAMLNNSAKEIANANHPRIRLLSVIRAVSIWPLNDTTSSWTECTPETAQNFSAVAYFFGREISDRENVPVGLIDSTWGGTPAQSWVSLEGLGFADLSAVLRDGGAEMQGQALADQIRINYTAQDAVLKAEGRPVPMRPRITTDYQGSHAPAVLFNGMIAPLTRYTIKGVIWYQGESDQTPQRALNYGRIFQALITDWRHQWAEGDFPFLFVQISSFGSHDDMWGQVRDAQRRALSLRNTEMAVSLDVGNPASIHPADKQTVGMRLALTARGGVYGERIEYASPEFLETTIEGASIRVWLTHAEGLTARGKALGGFELSSDGHNFVSAEAKIENIDVESTIVLTAPGITYPRYARYGWGDVVSDYLYNNAGLPLGTFSSQ